MRDTGVDVGDWRGNKVADELAGKSADAHGYSKEDIARANDSVRLVMRVQRHLVRTYIRML